MKRVLNRKCVMLEGEVRVTPEETDLECTDKNSKDYYPDPVLCFRKPTDEE
jgi:hypothetical protein